jgi:hypothetical protein
MTMIKSLGDNGFIATGDGVTLFSLLSVKGRLSLELKGMKFRGGSTFAYVKKHYGFTGNRQKIYDQYCEMVEKYKAEYAEKHAIPVKN